MEQKRQEQWEEQCRTQQEEEENREALRIQEEELSLEMQRMAKRGYQERVRKLIIPHLHSQKFFVFLHVEMCLLMVCFRFTADPGQHGHEQPVNSNPNRTVECVICYIIPGVS